MNTAVLQNFTPLQGLRFKDDSVIAAIVIILASCIGMFVLKGAIRYEPIHGFLPFITAVYTLVPLLFIGVKYAQGLGSFNILLRGATASILFYIAVNYQGYIPENTIDRGYLDYYKWFALAAGIASLWRPALAVIPACYVMHAKQIVSINYGLFITSTDYLVVIEVILFCACAMMALALWQWLTGHRFKSDISNPLWIIFIFALGSHFGNYFFSGVQKLILDPSEPWGWLWNETFNLAAAWGESGQVPISHLPIYEYAFWFLKTFILEFNIATLGLQLLSLFVFFRRWAMVVMTFFFDCMHIAIFIFSGVFFWKWILLNAVLIAACRAFPEEKPGKAFVIAGMVGVLFSQAFFTTKWLGWYDTRTFEHEYYIAVTDDGAEYKVPSNFFMAASVNVAQQRVTDEGETMTPYRTHNIALTPEHKAQGNACSHPIKEAPEISVKTFQEIEKFVMHTHIYQMERANEKGVYRYDLYPHHIWSNPWEYKEFAALDKRTIKSFKYVMDVKCIEYSDGKSLPDFRSMRRKEWEFEVPQHVRARFQPPA